MAFDWITTSEAKTLSGYNAAYLRRLIRAGKITAQRKGNAWWVDRQSVLRYIRDAQKTSDKRFGAKRLTSDV